MSDYFLWIVVGIVIVAIFVGISYLRARGPHSREMARKQGQLTKKPGVSAPSTPASEVPKTEEKKGWFVWVTEYLWSILLVIAGLVIFFQGIYFSNAWESPSFALVGRWSWTHWLQLFALAGIGSALLKLQKERLGAAESVLQSLLVTVMVTAFLVCPVIGWFEGVGASSHRVQQPASSESYKQPNKAMMLSIEPGGKSERIPVPFQMHVVMNGKDFRFHCVYADGHEESFITGERPCSDGDMPFVYATNTRGNEPNVITYSYEK